MRTRDAAPLGDRLETRLELRGGVERAADVGVDVGAVGAEALLHAARGASATRVPSPAMKPGTSSTGSSTRGTARAAYGGVRRSPRWPTACERVATGLADDPALAEDGPRPRGRSKPSGRRKSASVVVVTINKRSGEVARTSGSGTQFAHLGVDDLPSRPPSVDWGHVQRTPLLPGPALRIVRPARRRGHRVRGALRAGEPGHRALLPDLRLPRRRPAAAGDGTRRPDDWWDDGLLRAARAGGLLRHPLRQPRHRPLDEGPGPGAPHPARPRLHHRAGAGAVLPRATWPATASPSSTTWASGRRTWPGCRWAA